MKVYVIVRKDLEPAQQIVQACHAVAELFMLLGPHSWWQSLPEWGREHKTIVVLGVKNEVTLARFCHFKPEWLAVATFKEPDMDNQLTAAACGPVPDELADEVFGKFNLL